ncbi:hypothetical protein RSOL_406760, partial [Rhizoctonia solani AG-3 Rhs1AP]
MPRRTAAQKRMEERAAAEKREKLNALVKKRDQLLGTIRELGDQILLVLSLCDVPTPETDPWFRFDCEILADKVVVQLEKNEQELFIQRTMNSFALLDKEYLVNPEIVKPVVPTFHQRDDEEDQDMYALVGFAYPIMDGARRVSRALAGYTPLYEDESHPDLWQMKPKVLAVAVGTPFMGDILFCGCQIPCVLFPSVLDDYTVYAVQNPDAMYKPYWDATRVVWEVEAFQGNEEPLQEWVDVDLTEPRPWWMTKWAMTVMRLEHKLPPVVPGDPKRLAMLGFCRITTTKRRAPATEAEWLAIPESQSQEGDDEWGESDAESIFDNAERGLPTSSSWDPATKKSSTPQGKIRHKYPSVVRQNIERWSWPICRHTLAPC